MSSFDIKEYSKKYYQANKEKIKAQWTKWQEDNPEKRKAQGRRHYLRHREEIIARVAKRSRKLREPSND